MELKGPFRIDHIDYYIQERSPGIFMVSNDGERVLDIGRSNTDVKAAIKLACGVQRGLDLKYSYFWFGYTPNARVAFREHCKLWHQYRYYDTVENHPQPDESSNGVGCPASDCEWNKLNGLSSEDY